MDEISITKKMATSELTSFPVGLDKERPLIHADATSEHGSTEQTRRHRRKQ
ncbi:PR domain zinc finger protein 1-like isoform X1, partial [Biomphalaria glabrata]